MVILLVAIAVMLFLIAAAILFMHAQRRKREKGSANAGNSPYSLGPQYEQAGQFMQTGQFNQAGMGGTNSYGQSGQFVGVPGYTLPEQQGQSTQQSNYPPQSGRSGISPMPQGIFSPPPSPPTQQPQPVGQTLRFAQSDKEERLAGGSQGFYSQPTEAYNSYQPYAQYAQQPPQGLQQQSPVLPTCPNCGRPLVPNLPTCGVCGMPLEMMRR
jgi:hypothetical protein